MSRTKTATIMSLVFLATMGAYFYVRFKRAQDKTIEQDRGSPATAGFREFFVADAVLTDRKSAPEQGNGPRAAAIAGEMRQKAQFQVLESPDQKENADRLEAPELRTYCLLRGKYCMFLVYVPELASLPEEDQQEIALALWPDAQRLAAAEIPGYPTVGLGLRGHRVYGPVLIGGKDGDPLLAQERGRYVFYPYFEGEPSLQSPTSGGSRTGHAVARRSGNK